MAKTKIIKPFTSCNWIRKNDGSYRWTEKDLSDVIISEKTPQEAGLTREAIITVLFMKEFPSRDEIDEIERVWFSQEIEIKVKSDQSQNIWLLADNGRLYLKDIADSGSCMPIVFESTPNYTMRKLGKAQKIDAEEAMEIAKTSRYIFSKMIGENYAVTV